MQLATPLLVAFGGGSLIAEGVVSDQIGWPSIALAAVGGFALWRAGTTRAWKETAQGRGQRVDDLEAELAALRTELAIPERIEGIVRLMAETAERQDLRAEKRAEVVAERFERRMASLEEAIRRAVFSAAANRGDRRS